MQNLASVATAAAAGVNVAARRRSVRLDADTMLRIRAGRGTRLRCAGGVVWVTQEGCANDTMLATGSELVLEFDGTALAGPQRKTPAVVDVIAGDVAPALVDTGNGQGTRRDVFPRRSRAVAWLQRQWLGAIAAFRRVNAGDRYFDAARACAWRDGLLPRSGAARIAAERARMRERSRPWSQV